MAPGAQAALRLEGVEVTVGVQQGVAALDAESGNQHIHRTAHGDAGRPKAAVVRSGPQGQRLTAGGFNGATWPALATARR